MISRKTFYICISILLVIFISCTLWIYHSRQSEIDLLQGQLKAQTLQVGIWQTESQTAKADRDRLQKENEQLYSGIQADTMLMDYAYSLIGAQKVYITTVQKIMDNNNITYPMFIYKEQ
jgi:hypothetical protein